jgi:hypothetical protein
MNISDHIRVYQGDDPTTYQRIDTFTIADTPVKLSTSDSLESYAGNPTTKLYMNERRRR